MSDSNINQLIEKLKILSKRDINKYFDYLRDALSVDVSSANKIINDSEIKKTIPTYCDSRFINLATKYADDFSSYVIIDLLIDEFMPSQPTTILDVYSIHKLLSCGAKLMEDSEDPYDFIYNTKLFLNKLIYEYKTDNNLAIQALQIAIDKKMCDPVKTVLVLHDKELDLDILGHFNVEESDARRIAISALMDAIA